MKRIFGIMCVLFALSALYSAGVNAQDDVKIIYSEDFESYSESDVPEHWTFYPNNEAEGTYVKIEPDPNNPNNKVMALHDEVGLDQWKSVLTFPEPVGGYTVIEGRIRHGCENDSIHWTFDMPELFVNMLYQNCFTWKTYKGDVVSNNIYIDYTKWYDVKYEIDFARQCFNYYFDGALIFENMPFRTPDIPSISQMEFRMRYNTIYLDDIKITMMGSIGKIYTTLKSVEYYVLSGERRITNVFEDTITEEFMSHFVFVDESIHMLCEEDGETEYKGRYIKDGLKLVITSPDGTQRSVFNIEVRTGHYGKETAKLLGASVVFGANSKYFVSKNVRYLLDESDTSIVSFVKDEEFYVPLRALCKAAEKDLEWSDEKKCAVIDGKTVGETGQIPAVIINDRMYISEKNIAGVTDKALVYKDAEMLILSDNDMNMRKSLKRVILSEIKERVFGISRGRHFT